MLSYPVHLSRDGSGWLVAFPDIPEALTSGPTRESALEMARSALETAMDFYFEDKRPVPLPSKVSKSDVTIDLPASLSAKVLLLNEMLKQKIRPAELARRMDVTPQEVQRLINLHHASKIDTIDVALKALGKRLSIRLG
jgi:antitoxin HicB